MSAGLQFDPLAHVYTLDGVAVPSVTTILSATGLVSFDGVPQRTLEAARARGTRVHQAVHYLSEGLLDWETVHEADRGYVEAGAAFLRDSGFLAHGQERRLFHPVHRYAGTVDLFGLWDGQHAVADYKTTAGNPADVCAHLQLAAYAEALRAAPPDEWFDLTPTQPIARLGVALHDDGTYRVDRYRDPRDFSVFLAALTVFRHQRPAFAARTGSAA